MGRLGYVLWLLTVIVGLNVAGCQQEDALPVLPVVATPPVVATAGQPVTDADEFGVITDSDRQLVIWVPEFFQPHDTPPMPILADLYEQFRRAHPDVHLDIQTKAESGDSSLFNYLRYGQRMAPTILPDIVLLNTEQLWQAAELGVVQPLNWDGLTHTTDFFQFAHDAVSYQGQTIGVPYAADVMHLVYYAEQHAQAPITWADLMKIGAPYLFAAGHRDYSNESLLLQYVGAGGQLFADGSVSNPDALTSLFTFVTQAKAAGILPEALLTFKSTEETWSAFAANHAGFADVSAHLVLARQELRDNLGFAQIPTINGASVTIAHTWAFALVTPDAEQQELALELIDQLLEPTVHSAWSRTTLQLPTQISAYTAWLDASPYHEFLQRQLDVAIAIPTGRPFADFARRLQQAQESVLTNQLSVEEAVKFVQSAP